MRKLRIGICITSLGANTQEVTALQQLAELMTGGFKVTIYDDIRADNIFDSRSVEARLKSLEQACQISDIVVAWNGGFNAVEVLDGLSGLKLDSKKYFVGYSDNTLLANALPVLGKMRGCMGPMAKNWLKSPELLDWYLTSLRDLYFGDYEQLTKDCNRLGLATYRAGTMRGRVWGGNNYTFDLLQGTPFCPKFEEPFILLLEGEDCIVDKARIWQDFIRNLDSIMLQPGARQNIAGLIIGKFPGAYTPNVREIETAFEDRTYLKATPIVYDFPRGYRPESVTLPIGEEIVVRLNGNNSVTINKL